MTSNRTCGGCTACCKTHPVLSIDKPISKWCKDCIIGKGCSIYEKRPSECADFKCQWLFGNCEEKDRPDYTKIVIDSYILDAIGEKVIALYEVSEGALDRQFAQNITTSVTRRDNIPVLHVHLGAKRVVFYLPPNKVLTNDQKQKLAEDSFEVISNT